LCEQGDLDAAASVYEEVVREHQAAGAAADLAETLRRLAEVRVSQDRWDDAAGSLSKALAAAEAAHGAVSKETACVCRSLAKLPAWALLQGNSPSAWKQRAESVEQELARIAEEQISPEMAAAKQLWGRREFEEAEAHYRTALSLAESAVGPRHPLVLGPLTGLVDCLASQGREEESQAFARRCEAATGSPPGDASPAPDASASEGAAPSQPGSRARPADGLISGPERQEAATNDAKGSVLAGDMEAAEATSPEPRMPSPEEDACHGDSTEWPEQEPGGGGMHADVSQPGDGERPDPVQPFEPGGHASGDDSERGPMQHGGADASQGATPPAVGTAPETDAADSTVLDSEVRHLLSGMDFASLEIKLVQFEMEEDLAAAEILCQQYCEARLEQESGGEDAAKAYTRLSSLLLRQLRYEEAHKAASDAAAAAQRACGPDSPEVADALRVMARVMKARCRDDDAEVILARIREIEADLPLSPEDLSAGAAGESHGEGSQPQQHPIPADGILGEPGGQPCAVSATNPELQDGAFDVQAPLADRVSPAAPSAVASEAGERGGAGEADHIRHASRSSSGRELPEVRAAAQRRDPPARPTTSTCTEGAGAGQAPSGPAAAPLRSRLKPLTNANLPKLPAGFPRRRSTDPFSGGKQQPWPQARARRHSENAENLAPAPVGKGGACRRSSADCAGSSSALPPLGPASREATRARAVANLAGQRPPPALQHAAAGPRGGRGLVPTIGGLHQGNQDPGRNAGRYRIRRLPSLSESLGRQKQGLT